MKLGKWINLGRGNGSYMHLDDRRIKLLWSDGTKRRERIVECSAEEAVQFLSEQTRARTRRGIGMPAGSWQQAWEAFDWRGSLNDFSAKHMKDVKLAVDEFIEFVGGKNLDDVDARDVQDWLNSKAEEAKRRGRPGWARTANKKRGYLSAFFHVCRSMLRHNPVTPTDKFNEPKKLPRNVTSDEYAKVWRACEPEFRDLLDFLLLTGCRFGEARKLRKADIRDGIWTLQKRKCGVPLRLPLSSGLLELIMRQKGSSKGHVFAKWNKPVLNGEHGYGSWKMAYGDPIDDSWALDMLAFRCKLADVPRFKIHDLRHATGSWLGEMGYQGGDIQKMLGHTNPSTTQIYTHGDPVAMVAKMQAALEQRRKEAIG